MKLLPIAAATLCVFAASDATAQRRQPSPDELQSRYDAKLEGSWLKNAAWVLDFEEAKKQAAADGKQIFAYFTRSYSP